jgi:hypothetical protein
MNDSENIEEQVFEWYQKNWNGRVLPFFRRPVLTWDTSLSSGKYPWANEDAVDILEQYFEKFEVNKTNFSFIKYWPNEEVVFPFNFLRPKGKRWKWVEPEPLTLRMLAESAKAGRWLYD